MSLFGSDDTSASDTLKQALAQINNIGVPTPESMQVQLQQLVTQGIMTPQQAQAALVSGNAYDKVGSDNTGMDAEQSALGSLKNVVDSKGMDAGEQADLNNVLSSLRGQEKGSNDAILQDAAQRGSLTSGMTMAARLAADQGADSAANSNALNANAAAQQRMLSAMSSLGSLGGQVQGQQYGAAANQASAANAIQQFNAAQQQATNQFNTGTNNTAQAANLQNAQNVSNTNVANNNTNAVRNADLIQQNFNDKLAKASASGGLSVNLANNQTAQNNSNNQLTGSLLGAAGTVAGAYFGGPAGAAAGNKAGQSLGGAAHGMIVPGKPVVPGDSQQNDIKRVNVSPGEAIVPVSAMQQGPAGVMSFLQRMKTQGQGSKAPMHPKDVATVLAALSHMRSTDGGAI